MVVDFQKVLKEVEELKKKKKPKKKEKDFLKKKLKFKKILKPSQMTITIKKREIEPYKPIYMKDIIEQEKRSMFFD